MDRQRAGAAQQRVRRRPSCQPHLGLRGASGLGCGIALRCGLALLHELREKLLELLEGDEVVIPRHILECLLLVLLQLLSVLQRRTHAEALELLEGHALLVVHELDVRGNLPEQRKLPLLLNILHRAKHAGGFLEEVAKLHPGLFRIRLHLGAQVLEGLQLFRELLAGFAEAVHLLRKDLDLLVEPGVQRPEPVDGLLDGDLEERADRASPKANEEKDAELCPAAHLPREGHLEHRMYGHVECCDQRDGSQTAKP
mmetsp:Transcript_27815/g.88409  ORF Transcript_27815/g.88409 Transcript_27815/m.88409 type:complete len:255 (+) Transcript_27815:92-856(+)